MPRLRPAFIFTEGGSCVPNMDITDMPSSQDTNEDPTLPFSDAGEATFILTPENAEARVAFSEVVEWLQEQSEDAGIREAKDHARKYTWISSKRVRDAEATRLLRDAIEGDVSSSSSVSSARAKAVSCPVTSSEPDLELWNGVFYLALDRPPLQPLRGWTIGSFRYGQSPNDLVLCLRSADDKMYRVRRHQAVLQIHDSGLVHIRTASDRSLTYVNGTRISRKIHVLTEATMTVTFGTLRYRAEYTRFAGAQDYPHRLQRYLSDILQMSTSLSMLALTPTPSEASGSIKIGQWTLTTGTVGSGASGRVSVGVNNEGKRVALKRMTVGRDRTGVHSLQKKLEMLTSLVKSQNEDRLLQFVELITDDAKGIHRSADLWFVLHPAIAETLHSVFIKGLLAAGDERISISTAVLVDIIGATEFLHLNGWLHGDLKPDNIGIRTWSRETKSVVLLDLDGAQKFTVLGEQHPPKPGNGGTIGWLSPEREMCGYTERTDMWSIGVMALWMVEGRHPWLTTSNPWRPDHESSLIRSHFCTMYRETIMRLKHIKYSGLREAMLGMIRHPYAQERNQSQTRISATDALRLLLTSGEDEDLGYGAL